MANATSEWMHGMPFIRYVTESHYYYWPFISLSVCLVRSLIKSNVWSGSGVGTEGVVDGNGIELDFVSLQSIRLLQLFTFNWLNGFGRAHTMHKTIQWMAHLFIETTKKLKSKSRETKPMYVVCWQQVVFSILLSDEFLRWSVCIAVNGFVCVCVRVINIINLMMRAQAHSTNDT